MGKFILKEISVPVREAYNADIKSIIEQKVRKSYDNNDINFVSFQKKSIDARHKTIFNIVLMLFLSQTMILSQKKLEPFSSFEYEAIKMGSTKVKGLLLLEPDLAGYLQRIFWHYMDLNISYRKR